MTSKSLDVNSMKNIVKNQTLKTKKNNGGSGAINNCRAPYNYSLLRCKQQEEGRQRVLVK